MADEINKTEQVARRILDDYKHNVGDIYSQLVSACTELNLSVEEMNVRWESSSIFDLDKFEGIFFIITGNKYSKEKNENTKI